jgi:hypothetical protein
MPGRDECAHGVIAEGPQVEAGGVTPMQIIEQQEDTALGGQGFDEVKHLSEECRLTGGCADEAALGEGGGRGGQRRIRLVTIEEIEPRAVRGCLGELETAPDEHQGALPERLQAQRLGERRLANSRLTADEHEAALPVERRAQMLAQDAAFALTPHERRWPVAGQRGDGHDASLHRRVYAVRQYHPV